MKGMIPIFVKDDSGYWIAISFPQNYSYKHGVKPLIVFRLVVHEYFPHNVTLSGRREHNLDYTFWRSLQGRFVFLSDGPFREEDVNLWSLARNLNKYVYVFNKPLESLIKSSCLKLYRLDPVPFPGAAYKEWKVKSFHKGPCPRFHHSFTVDNRGEYAYLVGGFTKLRVKKGSKDDWIYYPTDDLWQINLNTEEWTRILDFSVPFPEKMMTYGMKIPDGFINLTILYDSLSHSIIGYGTKVRLDPSVRVDKKTPTRDCSFIIDIEKQTYQLIGDSEPHVLRISNKFTLADSEKPLWMFNTINKRTPFRSFYSWYGDSNRKLKQDLCDLFLQKMYKKTPITVYRDRQYLHLSVYQDLDKSLTWDILMKLENWELKFERVPSPLNQKRNYLKENYFKKLTILSFIVCYLVIGIHLVNFLFQVLCILFLWLTGLW